MKRLLISLVLVTSVVLPGLILVPSQGYADSKDIVCEGIGLVGSNGSCDEDDSEPNVQSIIGTVISILSYAVGVAAIIMLIVGGLKYVTSAGDATKVTSAKNTIMYALIGVVIAVLAQVLVQFVLTKATTQPPTTPNSPQATP